MIIQGLAAALRRQDWATVLIELVLVIAGVLIALQVNNWNEARQDRERGLVYLSRIESDLAKDIGGLAARIDYWKQVGGHGERALASIDAERSSGFDPGAALVAFMHASQANSYTATDTTHAELKSAGELTLIRDAALRADLSDYYALSAARSEWLFGMNPEYRNLVRGVMPLSFQKHYWENCYDVARDLSSGMSSCDVALGEAAARDLVKKLAARTDLIEALRSWIINLRISTELAGIEKRDAEALLERVGAAREGG